MDLDTPEIQRFIAGKRILVTGAGGSIGSEICRQTARFCPQQLVLLDRAENALFEIDRELRGRWLGADIVPAIADICDATRIDQLFATYKPQVIFHCAAHKHVPMMEANPGEAIKNNILGTRIVADAALRIIRSIRDGFDGQSGKPDQRDGGRRSGSRSCTSSR